MALPPCGLYRTTQSVAGVPAGRLVYFHNHGDPGAGLYLPSGWAANRASWHPSGHTLPDEAAAKHLSPLPPEGFYSVRTPFFCCEKRCVEFQQHQLVQLGYDGEGTPLVFTPELGGRGLVFPERGNRISEADFGKLTLLRVARAAEEQAQPRGLFVH
jgi:hypothetical protein